MFFSFSNFFISFSLFQTLRLFLHYLNKVNQPLHHHPQLGIMVEKTHERKFVDREYTRLKIEIILELKYVRLDLRSKVTFHIPKRDSP